MEHCLNFKEKSVLITGGTNGLGKAIAMAFSSCGADVYITHKWGSVDKEEIYEEFSQNNLKNPYVIQSDVSSEEDTENLFELIREQSGSLDVLISNVAFSKVVNDLNDLKKNALKLSVDYSAWPLVELTQYAKKHFDYYPKYIVGISSDGPDVCHPNYDLAGTSKAVLETLSKYLSQRLKPFGSTVNVIRPGFMKTQSSISTFGEELLSHLEEKNPDLFISPENVANVCVGICSGLMDSINGQIINVDNGASLISPISLINH